MSRIKIAIQNKGKLSEPSINFLKELGIECDYDNRQILKRVENKPVDILFVRDDDIPTFVEKNAADFGIVGENIVLEQGIQVEVEQKLGFGKCKMVIAVPKNSDIKSLDDLIGERIATTYPNILKQFLLKNKINASIITISGSAEIAPNLNLADAICDITQTGMTLKQNGLIPITDVFFSEAVLIKNKNNQKNFISSLKIEL